MLRALRGAAFGAGIGLLFIAAIVVPCAVSLGIMLLAAWLTSVLGLDPDSGLLLTVPLVLVAIGAVIGAGNAIEHG